MKKLFYSFLLLFVGLAVANSQTWNQIGSDIDGKAEGDEFGTTLSLNSDGSVVAIGAPLHSDDPTRIGYVQVFQNIDNAWQQMGSDIESDTENDNFGQSVSINSDGSIVAIGVPLTYNGNSNYGIVKVFENKAGTWTQLGDDIYNSYGAFFGTHVSIDSSGTGIAISDAHVRFSVYQINNGTWEQVGETLGENSNNLRSLAFSSDGSVVAISFSEDDGITRIKGSVSIYQNISDNWIKVGDIIEGEEGESDFGSSLSLNADGSIIAIGGDKYNLSSTGFVKIFKNISDQWSQIGNTIHGEEEGDAFGSSISLSFDGLRVAIGALKNQYWTGHIRVYQNKDGAWSQIGNDIDGEDTSNLFGASVSLSSDGLVVAGGAIWNDGVVSNSGHARVYKIDSSNSIEDQTLKGVSVYPNPTKGLIQFDFGEISDIQQIIVTNIVGSVIIKKTVLQENETIDLSSLMNGVYVISLQTEEQIFTTKVIKE